MDNTAHFGTVENLELLDKSPTFLTSELSPKGRIAWCVWTLCSMLLGFFYVSNLRAFILLPTFERFVDTDEDAAAVAPTVHLMAFKEELEWSNDPFG